MTTAGDALSPHNYHQSRTFMPKMRHRADLTASTLTTAAPTMQRAHVTSLASNNHDDTDRWLTREETYRKYPSPLLKNRNLLVSARLALKRQRAALKGPSLQFEPVRSNTLQMELGNPDDALSSDRDDRHIIESPSNSNPLLEQKRVQSQTNRTSPLRGDTPHTLPTDISLLYREKPSLYHPITGQFVVQYAEDNGNPSPCSYFLPRKSCREKNAPAYTFGTRCLAEKKGGCRTAWQKQWFAHSDPFTNKVDFSRETNWPTPFHYQARPGLGFQPSKVSFPAWSMASRLQSSPALVTEDNPSPDTYDTTRAFRKLTAKTIPITLKSRIGGTQLSTNLSTDITPGPGAHNNTHFLSNRQSAPKHTFGHRIPISLRQDPYINVVEPNRL